MTLPPLSRLFEQSALIERLLRVVLQDAPLRDLLTEALKELLQVSWLKLLPKGGIFVADEGTETLRLYAEHNLGHQITRLCKNIEFGQCLCGRAALHRVTQYAHCVDGRHEIVFEGIQPHGHYNVPIKNSGKLIGVLVVYLPHGHSRSGEEIRFLESFADILALILTAKQREEDLSLAHEQLKSALADSNSLMRAVRQHTIFSQTTREGLITEVNEAFCRISGYARSELIGADHRIINSGTHPPEFWADFWRTIRSGQAWRGEICNRAKDGEVYWVDSIVMPFRAADGAIERFISIRNDITERKRAEEALARMARILEHSSNEIYVFDAATLRFLLVNRGARDNLGYSRDEITALGPLDIKPDYSEEAFLGLISPLLGNETDMLTFETIHARKDGSVYPVHINLHFAREEHPPVFVAVVQDITDRRRKDEEIRKLAHYDQLTGLANRALFSERMEEAIAQAVQQGANAHLLYMDLDRFKQINDALGHAIGDEVLRQVANRLTEALPSGHTLARVGGDEFVAVLPGQSDDALSHIVDAALDIVETPFDIDGRKLDLGISMGVTTYPDHAQTAEELLRFADIAMYAAKVGGGGARIFEHNMDGQLTRRQLVGERLIHSLRNDALDLAFQPIIDLCTGCLSGAEVLLRWEDDELGQVSPAEVIPVADEYRLTSKLGAWVIDRTCRQIAEWERQGMAVPPTVAVNVSVQQLEDRTLCQDIQAACTAHGVSPRRLAVEITESSMMSNTETTQTMLTQLKTLGVAVSIDDFGTGYSSLAYLKQFAVEKLKIDISFVKDLLDDETSGQIVAATIAMANGLGLRIVAEGVESADVAAKLLSMGCSDAQGFFYEAPVSGTTFREKWLAPREDVSKVISACA
ncbi:EAL domain-containing protein [Jannaschia seohaensis]|uniref:PAS domain S-box-containing protein/diguanylate cyclase (GGDEF) domain-containing protein n=1 Tax=Jannaschia seohaensis TaxID=475081 RepID=A0A2Y9BB59_9RHOB|nr:EAL domain-containing protein [Jannaschia seohaensis]PWJ11198.1 PAS domain S-box-containing protein/diguanylate cyclase (GGDEF)-like protein [Jannaschia seohaensis]SSA51499.1 PAS domain S-box-containing protein/diguanylate cyclase (GGDEF) domain-containing protein [Jannaschia seohaensis]